MYKNLSKNGKFMYFLAIGSIWLRELKKKELKKPSIVLLAILILQLQDFTTINLFLRKYFLVVVLKWEVLVWNKFSVFCEFNMLNGG